MKTAIWQRCVKQYILPNLEGAWGLGGRILY